ncbi:uro-adherence factor A-like [Branchiostoma lanceolatum]|uniref:uro-adherence factor A-like n=1 Tax=Branchiostoma lanceolatum TaxID=7740 RepID=UPI0034522662
MECQDFSAHKDQSLLEDSQDEDNDESLLWFDTPEYLDVPQQPGQLATEQKQTQEGDRVNLVQWSNSAEVPQDSEHPKEKFEEQDKSQAPQVHTQQSSSVQKKSEEQDISQVLQWPDSLERYDGNEEHSMRHNQESSGQDISHHQKESQEHASDMNQVLLLSGDQEGKDVPTFQKQSIVQQHQIDENDASQGLLLSKGPEERNVPTIAEQLKFAVKQFLDQVMVPSESSEDQDALHEQKQPVTLQDQKEEKEKGDDSSESDSSEFQDVPLKEEENEASQSDSLTNQETLPKQTQQHRRIEHDTSHAPTLSKSLDDQDVLHHPNQPVALQDQTDEKVKGDVSSESDSSEFQDVPLQDDEVEASQAASLTEQEVSTIPKQSTTQRHQSKEQKTSEALPLSEGPEAKDILPLPNQLVVQHDQADDNGKGDVSSESDSSEFQDIPLHDDEGEASQSSSSTDQDAATLSKQSLARQQKLKEHETSKGLPFSERQGDQKDVSLLEHPTVPRHEAKKDETKQGIMISEGTEIQKGSTRPEQQEKTQMPPLSKVSKSQGGVSGQLAAQPHKAVDDDPTQVLLFDPEDNELPLSEGSTDQDDTPLQYFNTSSESDSSDFQDVPSDDEDASTFLKQPKVQRHRAEKQKSHVLPLSQGLKDRDAPSHSKQSSVQQHKTDQHEKTAKVSSESDSLEFEDIPSPVREFPKQRFEERGLNKSRTSVESEIPEDEGVLLSPLSPKEKHSLVLENPEDRQRGKERVSPQPKDLENRLLEANATIVTLMGELDQVRGEIKERANISTDVAKESEHRHRSDTKTPARSVEIGVNTEGDKIQEADLSQARTVYGDGTTKAESNTAAGEAKKQQKMVSCGVQTDFADNSDAAQQPAEKSEDKEVEKGKKPTGKTETKTKKRSAIVEILKDDEELKAKFNIAENLKKALAAKSKAGQQGKAEAPPSEPVKVAEIRHLDRITFGGKGSEPGKFNRPRGVAVSTKNEIFVADRDNRRIQVHNMKGEAIRQIPTTVPGQETLAMRPDDIAIDGNDLLWIVGSDWSTEFVIPYTMEGEPLGMFDLPDTVRFRGITVNPRNNHVIVTLTDKTFGTRGEVRVFRPDGWQLRRVGITQGMVAPMFVTLDKDDNILVSDYGTHSVYAFDQDGEFLFKFGGYGSGVGQLKDPRGICVDSSGNIIVADFGNKRLEMFTKGGKFLRHVTDSTGRPDGIAVGPDGQLVVTEWNHTASIIPSY